MNGDKKENKTHKDALKSVVKPLLIVIRKEIKEGNEKLLEHFEARPEVQETKITNPQYEIKVTNFPDEIKAKITNPQKEVEVKGLAKSLTTLKDSIVKGLSSNVDSVVKSIGEAKTFIKSHTFKVTVQNQKEVKFPKVQGVKLSDADMKKLIKGIKQEVQRVTIENSAPGEAIPVVLTNKDRRRFYDLLVQITGGTNLDNVKKLLQQIADNTGSIDIDIDTVNINLDDLEALAGKNLEEAFGEITGIAAATETTIVSLTVPAGKKWRFKYVYAEGDQVKDTVYRLFLNSTKKWQGRSAHQDRNVSAQREFDAVAGDVIALKVEHSTGSLGAFSGSIQLYDITSVT